MIGKERLLSALGKLVRQSKADQTLVSCFRTKDRVVKFSGQRITQNLEEEDIDVYIKVACNSKIGVAATNSLEEGHLKSALDKALEIARHSRKIPNPAPLSKEEKLEEINTCFAQTTALTPQECVDRIIAIHKQAQKHKLDFAGTFVIGEDEMAVVNSQGLTRYQPFTVASLKALVLKGKASGFACAISRDVNEIDFREISERAIEKCLLSQNPQDIPLGKYDCILEPEAVAEILDWLGYIGFGAKSIFERTSFLYGRIGDQLMGKPVTIYDDGLNPEGLVLPFDFEGTPRKKVTFIKDGIAQCVVYDNHYGLMYKQPSTGHALPPDEVEGPMALNLCIKPGNKDEQEMIKSVSRGILVSRFHYVNGFLNRREALMTGLTRDGTFLIENGKIKKALKNLRFTQSILKAFSQVAAISKDRRLVADPTSGIGACLVPTMLVRNFAFTGKST